MLVYICMFTCNKVFIVVEVLVRTGIYWMKHTLPMAVSQTRRSALLYEIKHMYEVSCFHVTQDMIFSAWLIASKRGVVHWAERRVRTIYRPVIVNGLRFTASKRGAQDTVKNFANVNTLQFYLQYFNTNMIYYEILPNWSHTVKVHAVSLTVRLCLCVCSTSIACQQPLFTVTD